MKKLINLFKEVFTNKRTYDVIKESTMLILPPMICVYFAKEWNEPYLYIYGFLFGVGLIGTSLISYMESIEGLLGIIKRYEEMVEKLKSKS